MDTGLNFGIGLALSADFCFPNAVFDSCLQRLDKEWVVLSLVLEQLQSFTAGHVQLCSLSLPSSSEQIGSIRHFCVDQIHLVRDPIGLLPLLLSEGSPRVFAGLVLPLSLWVALGWVVVGDCIYAPLDLRLDSLFD